MRRVVQVRGPDGVVGVLRPGEREASFRPGARRLRQQRLDGRLAIVAVRAEITEVPVGAARLGVVELGIDRAIQNARRRGAELALETAQRRPAGERQVEVVAGYLARRQIA